MEEDFSENKFRPTDKRIIMYYLKQKMMGFDFPIDVIDYIDICEFEPWELPEKSALPDDQEWYFFWEPHIKREGFNRTTKGGYWKVSGQDRPIWGNSRNELIGFRRTLVYHKGRRSNPVRTSWIIHEFHSDDADFKQQPLVLCRLRGNLNDKSQNCTQGESSSHPASES